MRNQMTRDILQSHILAAAQPTEHNLRIQLAYLYRIFNHYQWSDLIVTHLSVRVPNEKALLINPFGLSFDEITPDSLVKIDFDGQILDSPLGFVNNKNGGTVHRAIYRNRPDIHCILHTHSHHGVAVSSLEEGLMLLDQIGMMFHGKVGYHEFETLFINDEKQEKLLEDLGNHSVMILHNHGLLSVGSNIPEAFWFHYYLEHACKVQVMTMSTGGQIRLVSEQTVRETADRYTGWRAEDSRLLFEAAKRQVGLVFGD